MPLPFMYTLQVDAHGNVYGACSDGTHIWDSKGTLLGKIYLGSSSANMILAGDGRLVIMGETEVYIAQIAAKGLDLASFGRK